MDIPNSALWMPACTVESIVDISEGGVAFVPAALPFSTNLLTAETVLALAEAEAELGRLDGQAESLPNPELLIAPFLRREAILSSRIEGTQTTYSELVLFEAAEEELKSADAREVNNYSEALRYAVRRVADVSFSPSLPAHMLRPST